MEKMKNIEKMMKFCSKCMGDEKEIKRYILGFTENDDDYDIFIQKLQEFAKMDNIEVIEEMINDEELISFSKEDDDLNFDDDQDYENYLYTDEEQEKDKFIPEDKEDELSFENLQKEVGEDSGDLVKDILGDIGIKDLSD